MRTTYICEECATKCELSLEGNLDDGHCPVDTLAVTWMESKNKIPKWLRIELIGKTEEFIKLKYLDSYQEGYDDAINWVLSLEGDS